MDGLVEFKTDDGALVVVEAVDDGTGSRLVARDDGTVPATRTFEGALEGVRAAAQSALRVFRDGSLRPDSVEIEFGVKLTAEAGALIAKSTVEGHLVVKLSWAPGESGRDSTRHAPEAASGGTPGAGGTPVGPGATPGAGGTPGIGPAAGRGARTGNGATAGTGGMPENGPTPGNGPGIPPVPPVPPVSGPEAGVPGTVVRS
jgi:hypothetical protein